MRCGRGGRHDSVSALPLDCERALARSARVHGCCTRQQARAAARRFVRRHRRDTGYLVWVLRSVATSSALAIALLGLSGAPVRAEIAPFGQLTSGSNPLSAVSTGAYSFSAAALADLDGDGDLDVVAGLYLGTFRYFRADLFGYVELTGAANPLNGQDVGFLSNPELGDLDGDGDLDLIAGERYGQLRYYQNTGTATSPAFVARTGAANPLNGQDVGFFAKPTLGDLDGDGDLDLVVGEYDGVFNFFENTGSATTPAFVARTGAANPLDGKDIGLTSAPTLGDLDADGDLDLVSGQDGGTLHTYENTGNVKSPAFVARTASANPLDGRDVGFRSNPTLADFDRDGDLDVFVGSNYGTFAAFDSFADRFSRVLVHPFDGVVAGGAPALGDLDGDGDLDYLLGKDDGTIVYFQNVGSARSPTFSLHSTAGNPLAGVDVGSYAHPAFGDFDDDGDLDLVIGAGDGTFFTFGNTGSASSPAFFAVTGGFNPLVGRDVGYLATPALADLDRDGDLDLISGEYDGVFNYFENTGGTFFPQFVARTGSSNPLNGFDVGRSSAPALGDLEHDGDLDVVAGNHDGMFRYFHNFGTATIPSFGENFGTANPMDREDVGRYAKPSLGDFDGDGDLDLVSGDRDAGLFVYRSSIAQVPLKAVALTGAANPLLGQDVGSLARPALADLDADGDADLLVGEYGGAFLYYENTGSATDPKFAARTGSANPMLGRDAGDAAAPAFADLDRDGDFDVMAGDLSGNLIYFENTGDAKVPAFASPITNAFGLSRVDDASAPSFGDFDHDGDFDLLLGGYSGFAYFRNTGSATNPSFALQTGAWNPLVGEALTYASPAVGDFDGDGDLDVFAGAAGGRFTYFVHPSFDPSLVRVPGPANPLASTDLGFDSAPAAADLDGDGDLDLVTGNFNGTFAVHYIPEPAHTLMLAAGAALLGWLRRRGTPGC